MPGRIRQEDIANVRERSPIADVVGEYLQLRPAGGGSLKGLCPFHEERSPSFNVTPGKELYHCFSCGEGGDVITFIRKIEHLDFTEAVERLAARAHVELRYEQGGYVPGQEHSQRRRLIEAHTAAQDFYLDRLATATGHSPATAFLAERGFSLDDAAEVRRRLLAQRLGRARQAPAAARLHRGRAAQGRPGQKDQPGRPDRHVPRPPDVADQGPDGGDGRVRRAEAERRRGRAEVPQHARDRRSSRRATCSTARTWPSGRSPSAARR